MKSVMLDTNILVSAILKRNSVPYKAYMKAIEVPYRGLVCDNILEELRSVFIRKFPDSIALLDSFVAEIIQKVEIVPTPLPIHIDEAKIPDVKDRPILRAAISAKADIIVTGDNDFLLSGITNPRIMKASDFCDI